MKTNLHIRKSIYCATVALLFLILTGHQAFAQNRQHDHPLNTPPPRLEVRGDNYLKSPAKDHPTSPAYKKSEPGFSIVQVNVNENGENIIGDASNEPSIAIDPNDPDKMTIGWRHFETISNNFRQAGMAYTTDGGETWTFPGVIDPGVFRSDPVLGADNDGNFYYNSLTVVGEDYSCDVYKSLDGGNTWDNGTFAFGGDKQWMLVDQSGATDPAHIYAFWTQAYSICDPDFFTRSVDAGLTYQACIDVPGFPYWGTLATDSNGKLYIGGAGWGGFVVARSSNAQTPGSEISWDLTSNVNLDGSIIGFGGFFCPNPDGLLGQTSIGVDRSGGPYDGNVYLLCSVERNSNNDPCDVMFSKSTDGGTIWSSPMRINDDPGNNAYQWFGTMSVAPTGRIDVIWLDTRDNPGQVNSALYYTYSLDGGESWLENVKLSDSFDPHLGWPQQNKMGDYFGLISDEEGAHLAWAATFNGEQDVYYSRITTGLTGISENQPHEKNYLFQNYPNPFKSQTMIQYHVEKAETIALKVFDLSGREISTLVNETKQPGNYNVKFDAAVLKQGVYYYSLITASGRQSKKMMVID